MVQMSTIGVGAGKGMFSEYRNSKVLVTGGLGFIGSNLALQLAAAGAEVGTLIERRPPVPCRSLADT